jgi:WD40 repeat protein
MPEVHPKDADIKRACISKIRFNEYGDRILSSNMEGNFTIYQFETTSKAMRKLPIFSLQDSPDLRISDFDLLSDSVVATLRDKKLRLYDTLLPYSGRAAMQHEFKLAKPAGNMLLVNKRRQTVCTFNGRTGAMSEFDLRKSLQFIRQIQLSETHEVTAACLSPNHDTLITGYKNGLVKVHRVADNFIGSAVTVKDGAQASEELVLREQIAAFPYSQGKKGHVTSIKVANGAVFVSSQAGVLKLLRTSI